MIAGDAAKILRVAHAEDSRLQQVLQRTVVVLQPEFAQAEERVGRAVLRRQTHDLAERRRGTAVKLSSE